MCSNNHYNERILKLQKERIAEIIGEIKVKTEDDKWWDWEG
ncbi:hypothetical protein [Pedobacter miscanthi]|nr:hypothetical protein [Pedobacter miscanthi]